MTDQDTTRHGWIDLLTPDGPFIRAAALDPATVGERWPTRLDPEQRTLLLAPSFEQDEASWDERGNYVEALLTDLLGYRAGKTLSTEPELTATHHIYRAQVRADFVVHAPNEPDDARMVVLCGPAVSSDPKSLEPDRSTEFKGWVSTPVQRAALLARHAKSDLALVTNGQEHLLVNVVTGSTGSAVWTVNALEDRHAQDAFVALLHKERVLHRNMSTARLIELSQDRQQELTDTLGRQVRQAAEALVNAISRANRATRGELLANVSGQEVYAATTRVLMRIVFLLVAEERGLLPLAENQLYADQYAISTLLDGLEDDYYRNRSAMQRRSGAWERLLALSRALHAGVDHDELRLPAYGGALFDPDEHPFLEGRVGSGTGSEGFRPLDVGVVDDHTLLTVLRQIQVAGGQRISFRSLDVEQIGHVYESLLDHSAVIVSEEDGAVLGLQGRRGEEPEMALADLEEWREHSDTELGERLASVQVAAESSAVYDALNGGLDPDSDVAKTLNVAAGNDDLLRRRIEPFAPLLRTDARGVALVFLPGDVYVTETSSKRDTGTAYTPRSLAEEIAKHALDPLIYEPGPHNEPDQSKWELRPPSEIMDLKVCDPAVGSAAILVAAARYLSEALLQSRIEHGILSPGVLDTAAVDANYLDVRIDARRDVVSNCIYGVDRDPMAVEMAKLSLWLVTMAKDRPFTFLDHAIRHGDSLLGITRLDQLRYLHLDVDRVSGQASLPVQFGGEGWWDRIDEIINRVHTLRNKLRAIEVIDIEDAREKRSLHGEAEQALGDLKLVADAAVAAFIATADRKPADTDAALASLGPLINKLEENRSALRSTADRRAERDNPNPAIPRRFLHWPLAFPEVFEREPPGFDAMIANPPYMGNKYWKKRLGSWFQVYFARLFGTKLGKPDLVVPFIWRICDLASEGGTVGTLSTQSISEVDSKTLMESVVLNRAEIYRAVRSREWPGAATVVISELWLTRREWDGDRYLDGETVDEIAADLRPARELADPVELADRPFEFQGVDNSKGLGFVLDRGHDLVREEYADVVKPYLSGSDLTQGNPLQPERYVIDLTGYSWSDVEGLPQPLKRYVMDVVQPTRTPEELKSYKGLADRWWTFWNTREQLFDVVRERSTCLVAPGVAKYFVVLELPSDWVYTNMVGVFDKSRPDLQTILLSPVFELWLLTFGGTLGSGRRLKSDAVVNTFPVPDDEADASAAEEWQATLLALVEEHGGATKVLNLVHGTSKSDSQIQELRSLHEWIARSTFASYGWKDLDYEHGFNETVEGVRWSVSPAVADEVLRRTVELNHSRHEAGR